MPRQEAAGPTPATVAEGTVVDRPVVAVGPLRHHLYRWGRITEVIDGEGPPHYEVLWIGDNHDAMVMAPEFSRIESETDPPAPSADAIGGQRDLRATGK